ncbi:hypothetical protein D3C72_1149710 [compost metagenome]
MRSSLSGSAPWVDAPAASALFFARRGTCIADILSAICLSRSGMAAIGRMMSTMPVAMALRGMASCSASSGCWANVTPPCSLMRASPSDPSDPPPVSTMPTARVVCTSASVRKNSSMATRLPCDGCVGLTLK